MLLLAYRVDWPINIIISDSCLHKYLKIFHFLLALRRLANVLTGLYFHMKQTQILFDVTGSVHFAKLQYARHLMQHLSNVMSDYVQDQLLNVSHVEFERSFEQAKSVDDMHESHAEYLNAMLSRLVFIVVFPIRLSYWLEVRTVFCKSSTKYVILHQCKR